MFIVVVSLLILYVLELMLRVVKRNEMFVKNLGYAVYGGHSCIRQPKL
jgi:hypothetical protein